MLASILPRVERQVVAGLRRRGMRRDAAVDAFRDALVRLYAARPVLDGRTHLARWLSLVAFRLSERTEAQASRTVVCPRPDTGTAPDVAVVVEHRLALEATMRELGELRPDQQAVILAATGLDGTTNASLGGTEGKGWRLRLHRARKALRLRPRVRDWLAGLPLGRLPWRRGPGAPVPSAVAGLSMVAVIGVASVVGASLRARSDARFGQLVSSDSLVVVGRGPTATAGPVPAAAPEAVTSPPPTRRAVRDAVGAPEAPPPNRIVVAPLPGSPTAAGASDREDGNDSLLCWGNVPLVDDRCIRHPLHEPLLGR